MYPYIQLGPLRLATYGLCLAAALIASWFIVRADLARHGFPKRVAEMMVGLVSITGVVGAKLYYMLETSWPPKLGAFRSLLSPSGFSWVGAVLTGIGVLCLLARINRIPVLTMLDLGSPTAALCYAIGRFGCLLAGDGDYGINTSLPWGMAFPHGTVPTLERVHPTPIYESVISLGLFYYLWRKGGHPQPRGWLCGIYLVVSGSARFLVEFIKRNPRVYFGLTNEQVVSALCVIVGAWLLARSSQRRLEPGPGSTGQATPGPAEPIL